MNIHSGCAPLFTLSGELVLIFVLPYFTPLPPPFLGPWTEKGQRGRASTVCLCPFLLQVTAYFFPTF